MARTVTLASLQTQVRQRADMVGSEFITNVGELDEYVNQSVAELYDLLVQADEDYYTTSASRTATNGVASVPTDFYKLRSVDVVAETGLPIQLDPVPWGERELYQASPFGYLAGTPRGYVLRSSSIELLPHPSGSYTFTLWYVPAPPRLDAGGTITFDGNAGWEEYVVVDAAYKCLFKEESFEACDRLLAQKAALRQRILSHHERDLAPKRVTRRRLSRESRLWRWT